jgi:type IV pilus assembly protein PilP
MFRSKNASCLSYSHTTFQQALLIALTLLAVPAWGQGGGADSKPTATNEKAKPVATEPAQPASGSGGAAPKPSVNKPAATPIGQAKVNEGDPNVKAPPSTNIFSGVMEPFDYDARGRRDPFSQTLVDKAVAAGQMHGPLLPLQRFDLNQYSLKAIIWDVHRPQALIKDPEGHVYILTPNAKIGTRNGYVAAIREGEIVVVETSEQEGRLVSTPQVVKLVK